MRKRLIAIFLSLSLCVSMLAGCGAKPTQGGEKPQGSTGSEVQAPSATSTVQTIDKAGTYTAGKGIKEVVIEASDVVLENCTVDKVTISQKVGDGDVTLRNVNAKDFDVNGGGKNTVKVFNSVFVKITSARADGTVHLVLDEKSSAEILDIINAAIIDIAGIVKELTIAASAAGTELNIQKGSQVSNASINALANIKIGENVQNLIVTDKGEGTAIDIAKGVSLESLGLDVKVSVTGEGKLILVITDKKDNLESTMKPEKTIISETPIADAKANQEPTEQAGTNTNTRYIPRATPAPVAPPEPEPEAPAKPIPTPEPEAPAKPIPTPEPEAPAKPIPTPEPTPTPTLNLLSLVSVAPTQVMLTFSEAIDVETGSILENYILYRPIDRVEKMKTVEIQSDPTKVLLTTVDPIEVEFPGEDIEAIIKNVKAASGRVLGTAKVAGRIPYIANLTAIKIENAPISIVVPNTGTVSSAKMSVVAIDQNGRVMGPATDATLALDPEVAGVSIENGVVTIDTALLAPGQASFTVVATGKDYKDDKITTQNTIDLVSEEDVKDALKAVNDAAEAVAMGTALTENAVKLAIDLTEYNNLSDEEKATVAQIMFSAKETAAFADALSVSSKFNTVVANTMIATTKKAIENHDGYGDVSQAGYETLSKTNLQMKAWLAPIYEQTKRTQNTIKVTEFKAAVRGSKADHDGIDGYFKFTVTIEKLNGEKVTMAEKTIVIKPVLYGHLPILNGLKVEGVGEITIESNSGQASKHIATTISASTTSVVVKPETGEEATFVITADGDATVADDKQTVTLSATSNVTIITITVTSLDTKNEMGYRLEITKKAATQVTNKFTEDKALHTVKYDGSTIDVATLFTLDANAGTATYTVAEGTGTGTLEGQNLTVTKTGTIEVSVETAAKGEYAAGAKVTGTLTVEKGDGPAAPTATSAFGENNSTTTITGLDSSKKYEYALGVAGTQPDNFVNATQGDNAVFTNLAVGEDDTTIYIRQAANASLHNVGATQELTLNIAKTISKLALDASVTAPEADVAPNTSFVETSEYTGEIKWPDVDGKFKSNTVYKAEIKLTPKEGYLLKGILENTFTYSGAVVTNAADSGTIEITFAATGIILKDQAPLTIETDKAALIYGEDAPVISLHTTEIGSGNGEVTYAIIEGNGTVAEINAEGIITILNAGTFKVKATKAAEGEFKSAVSNEITITVNKKELTITNMTVDGEIVYNGNRDVAFTGGTLEGAKDGDDVALAPATGVRGSADAGDAVSVTVTLADPALTGTKADNYTVKAPTDQTVKVKKAPLTITGVTVQETRIYDGTKDVTIEGGALNGVVENDDVQLGALTGTRASKNVGDAVNVTIADPTLTGAASGNYDVTAPTVGTVNVTAKPITATIENPVAAQKVYDGNNEIKVTGDLKAEGKIEGDDISLTLTGTAKSTDVGAGIEVEITSVLSGSDIGNYIVTAPTATTTVEITKATPAAPVAPTIETTTDTSVTLVGGTNIEYSISTAEGEWKDTLVFTGLEPETQYFFFARYKGDKNHNPSPASESVSATTAATETP